MTNSKRNPEVYQPCEWDLNADEQMVWLKVPDTSRDEALQVDRPTNRIIFS